MTAAPLKPIFNKNKIEAGFEIASAFIRESSTFLANRSQETGTADAALKAEIAKPTAERDPQKIEQLTQIIADNQIWAMGSPSHLVLTALTGAAGSNVTGGAGELLQNTAGYLQGLGAAQVKELADALDSEVARAALQAINACAGAAAGSGNCGSAAPVGPLSQLRRNRPSFFMCPIAGSMALRRRIFFLILGVTALFCPLRQIVTSGISTPR